MSSRRLARAGKTTVAPERGTPAALSSRDDPLWQDAEAVRRLAEIHGLTLDAGYARRHARGRPEDPVHAAQPWERFDAFRVAWCRANGLMHPVWKDSIDYQRAQDAGIDMSASSRYRLRRTVPDSVYPVRRA